MDALLVGLYILAASVNAAGLYFFYRYLRDWWRVMLRPSVIPAGLFYGEPAPAPLSFPPFPVIPLRDLQLGNIRRDAVISAFLGRGDAPGGTNAQLWQQHQRMLGGEQWRTFEGFGRRGGKVARALANNWALRAQLGPATLHVPPPLSATALGHPSPTAAPSTETRMNQTGSTFYILKTARNNINREGRFIAIDSNDNISIGPSRADQGIKIAKRFASIGDILVAIDGAYGLSEAALRGLRICRVTETVTEPMRAVQEVSLSAAKTAKLVVRLDKLGSYQLFRQGDGKRYGPLETAQVFDGLADLQRRAPQTYTNSEREVLMLVEQPGRSTFEEVEVK